MKMTHVEEVGNRNNAGGSLSELTDQNDGQNTQKQQKQMKPTGRKRNSKQTTGKYKTSTSN